MPRMKGSPLSIRFGAVIRRVRLERGWSIVTLAQHVGMSASYLSVLEQGGNDTTLSTIVKLCSALGADIGEVMREVAAVRNPRPEAK